MFQKSKTETLGHGLAITTAMIWYDQYDIDGDDDDDDDDGDDYFYYYQEEEAAGGDENDDENDENDANVEVAGG